MKALIVSIFGSAILLISPVAFAVDISSDACKGSGDHKQSAFCQDSDFNPEKKNPVFGPDGVLTNIVNLLSIIVGIVAVIMIIVGGIRFVASGSNPQDVTRARETILYAVIAVVIAALAQVLVRFILSKIV